MPHAHECMSTKTPTPNLYEQVLRQARERRAASQQHLESQVARIQSKQPKTNDQR